MLKPKKPNSRLVDTIETATIKPISPTPSKNLVIEELDMPLSEYLKSIGLGDVTPEKK